VRIGVFGGSFDPPHVGHLLLAVDAVEALALDRLVFVPAAQQPLKASVPEAAAHRLAMVRLLAGDDPRLAVDAVETDRGGLSFTVDTLRHFRASYPAASLLLLLGADAAALLPQWREPATVLALARLAVWQREDRTAASLPPEVRALSLRGAGEPIALSTRRLDVSSTEVRARLAAGRTVRGFVPDAVADYIAAHGLYAGTAGPAAADTQADAPPRRAGFHDARSDRT
jgi:nicotinate-nucleotide adenylyltransferase